MGSSSARTAAVNQPRPIRADPQAEDQLKHHARLVLDDCRPQLPRGDGDAAASSGAAVGPSAGSSIPPVAPHLHDRVLKVKLHSAVLKFARGNDALLPPDMQQDRRDGFALGTRAGLEKAYHVRRRPG